jgi:hypothetical protein
VAESGRPPGEMARELGFRGDMPGNWRRQFASALGARHAFLGMGVPTS